MGVWGWGGSRHVDLPQVLMEVQTGRTMGFRQSRIDPKSAGLFGYPAGILASERPIGQGQVSELIRSFMCLCLPLVFD